MILGTTVCNLAVSAFLARYKGQSRIHSESDLNAFLRWCEDSDLDPLTIRRVDLELYLRWMQVTRRYKPSTVSRRLSVVTGFYRTCVIDGVLEHSPAEYVRRPRVPPESPTLGLSHLQFEAILTAARDSINVHDSALVSMLGLLGLRVFEATGPTSRDSARSTDTGSCACTGRATRSPSHRYLLPSGELSTAPGLTATPARSC